MSSVYSRSSGRRQRRGVDVGENRLLGKIVADHVGHVGVDALVVCHARSGGVHEGHVAELIGVYQPRHAEQRVGTEDQRIDEVVVHAPVDHVDAAQALRGPHVDVAIVDQQVAPLDELGPDLLGQEDVLVERRVVHARRQQRDRRVGAPHRGQLLQGLEQHLAVVLDLLHSDCPVQAAQTCLGRLAVREHVGHTRRDAQVVLQHFESVVRSHQIGAAYGDPRAVGGREAAHLDAVLRTAAHHVDRDYPVVDDAGHSEAVIAP